MKSPSKASKSDAEKHPQKEKKVKDHCMEGYRNEDDNLSEKKTKERFPRKKWMSLSFKINRRKPC